MHTGGFLASVLSFLDVTYHRLPVAAVAAVGRPAPGLVELIDAKLVGMDEILGKLAGACVEVW